MHHYEVTHFCRYYNGAMIRTPDGKLAIVAGPNDNESIVVQMVEGRKAGTYKLKDLDWEHMREPELGYRNELAGGKNLYYIQRKVGRIAARGVSHHALDVEPATGVYAAMTSIGLAAEAARYMERPVLNSDLAVAIFKKEFLSLDKAVYVLKNKHDAVGIALHPDFAVVKGLNKRNAITLLWKQLVVATSEDGNVWNAMCSEYRDIISRNLGKLTYA
jgi:hypothetical protein